MCNQHLFAHRCPQFRVSVLRISRCAHAMVRELSKMRASSCEREAKKKRLISEEAEAIVRRPHTFPSPPLVVACGVFVGSVGIDKCKAVDASSHQASGWWTAAGKLLPEGVTDQIRTPCPPPTSHGTHRFSVRDPSLCPTTSMVWSGYPGRVKRCRVRHCKPYGALSCDLFVHA